MFFTFLFAAILIAIVGYIIGFPQDSRASLSRMETKFVDLFVTIAKCDGKNDPLKILPIKSYISSCILLKTNRERIIKCLNAELKNTQVHFLGYEYEGLPIFIKKRKKSDGQQTTEKVSDLVAYLAENYIKSYHDRMDFLDVLFQIAYSQDGVSDMEVDLLREVAHYLHISSWNFTTFLYKYEYLKREQREQEQQYQQYQQKKEQKRSRKKRKKEKRGGKGQKAHETRFNNVTNTRTKEALQLLEITENADEQEIKSAYRRMAKKYHPDKLPAGISEKDREEAVERFRSIHEAYEFLMEQIVLLKKIRACNYAKKI